MSDVVIQCEALGKSYSIGHQGPKERYATLRESIGRQARGIWNATKRAFRGQVDVAGDQIEEFWALKDVSFEVKRGDVLGIIGRNGAGKSTLLKILSRITEPTAGRVTLRGSVASLLEVGTGFHPELTGRENIFLNGAILGMTRAEIKRKFDEIVAFAEVEKFLDTPVKRYSSGMYVRLAFAVAAHLEPEILVVDEVLAVGDAEFQKKCLSKMQDASRGGRTVLFVSHNMNAVERLCTSLVHLASGSLAGRYADCRAGVSAYLNSAAENQSAVWRRNGAAIRAKDFIPSTFEATSTAQVSSTDNSFPNSHSIQINVEGELNQDDPALNIGIGVYDETGQVLFWSFLKDSPEHEWPALSTGVHHLTVHIPPHMLNEGTYRVELLAGWHCREWFLEPGVNAPFINFSIRGGLSESPLWHGRRPGSCAGTTMEGHLMSNTQVQMDGIQPSNLWLLDFKQNAYSQCGEDGVISKILDILPETDKWCVEFGAWDGKHLSNTWNLISSKGYSGVLIEGDPKKFEVLKKNVGSQAVIALNNFVGFGSEDNLDGLLEQTPIPCNFDFLSIDIDGNDYHVWNATTVFRPKVVCLEFNPTIPDEVEFVQPADRAVQQGSSLQAIANLGKKKGYELVSVLPWNAIFVRREYFDLFFIGDNRPATLRQDRSFVTYLFSGYDGTIHLCGNRTLPWHGTSIDESKLQVLPFHLRTYPDNYTILQKWHRRLVHKLQRVFNRTVSIKDAKGISAH